ncbi:hypothetical protein Csa_022622 [Cucumis sativus]|uniref:Uncharacterized protein n=1 Tax=Cucumis sativus TaxID=3659 RepID=A0A0A0LQ47_CUCSA|nr:hypothetical protein Csa_022622 [Cucumis sativus]
MKLVIDSARHTPPQETDEFRALTTPAKSCNRLSPPPETKPKSLAMELPTSFFFNFFPIPSSLLFD